MLVSNPENYIPVLYCMWYASIGVYNKIIDDRYPDEWFD